MSQPVENRVRVTITLRCLSSTGDEAAEAEWAELVIMQGYLWEYCGWLPTGRTSTINLPQVSDLSGKDERTIPERFRKGTLAFYVAVPPNKEWAKPEIRDLTVTNAEVFTYLHPDGWDVIFYVLPTRPGFVPTLEAEVIFKKS